jgi:hypothetical protein
VQQDTKADAAACANDYGPGSRSLQAYPARARAAAARHADDAGAADAGGGLRGVNAATESFLRLSPRGEAIFAAMKKLLFLGACLVALASQPAVAQTGGPDVIVVRVAEHYGQTHLTIERAGQEPEEITFEWNPTGKGARASKGYYDVLAKLYQQGYQTQAIIPGAGYTKDMTTYTTLVFTRPASK